MVNEVVYRNGYVSHKWTLDLERREWRTKVYKTRWDFNCTSYTFYIFDESIEAVRSVKVSIF